MLLQDELNLSEILFSSVCRVFLGKLNTFFYKLFLEMNPSFQGCILSLIMGSMQFEAISFGGCNSTMFAGFIKSFKIIDLSFVSFFVFKVILQEHALLF